MKVHCCRFEEFYKCYEPKKVSENLRIYQNKFITVNSRKEKRNEKLEQNIKLPETIFNLLYINSDIINDKNRNRQSKYKQGYHI